MTGAQEYVPSNMFDINRYFMDYIWNTGKPIGPLNVYVTKGPDYDENSPQLVKVDEQLVFMSPNLPFVSYTRTVMLEINGIKDITFKEDLFLCGTSTKGGKLKLGKPKTVTGDPLNIPGIFDLIATFDGYPDITYFSYHVQPLIITMPPWVNFDINDFFEQTPEIKKQCCVLNSSNTTNFGLYDIFLKKNNICNTLQVQDCDTFMTTYCNNEANSINIDFRKTCACLKPNFSSDIEKNVYNYLKTNGTQIPAMHCINSYCSYGSYIPTPNESCSNSLCNGGPTGSIIIDSDT